MLSFQKLRVYQRSIQFLVVALEIIGDLPKGHAELADQLLRAAQSQPRNIAEGAGRRTTVDQARFYTHARGSAMGGRRRARHDTSHEGDDRVELRPRAGSDCRDAHEDDLTSSTSKVAFMFRFTSTSRSRFLTFALARVEADLAPRIE